MWTSYFREVCGLELEGDLWQRALDYEATMQSACWWWPYRDFVMVCDRPAAIHLEQIGERGWGSHRLHCEDGPAIVWRDSWGLYFIHGIRTTQQVVEAPETLTREQVLAERNAEVRRVIYERLGAERFVGLLDLKPVQSDEFGTLYRAEQAGDEDLVVVKVANSTPEPDGSIKEYWLRCEPRLRPMKSDGTYRSPQDLTAVNAVASTFGMTGPEYRRSLCVQT